MNVNLSGDSFGDEVEVRARHWHVKPGDVVLDVGASEGSYTLPALLCGAAKVYAFNPGKLDADKLAHNLTTLPADVGARCEIVRLAVGSRAGWFDWSHSKLVDEEGEGLIRATTLDDWWLLNRVDVRRVDWVKIDVEGAEVEVLRGAEQLVRCFRPKILVENHVCFPGLADIGTRVRKIVFDFNLDYTVETNPWHSVTHSFFSVPA